MTNPKGWYSVEGGTVQDQETATEIRIGQIWREVDPRFERLVEIVEVTANAVRGIKIKTISVDGKPRKSSTWVSKGRFNGKRGGYELTQSE